MEAVSAPRPPVRPSCPRHPGSRVRLDGYVPCRWSDAHRRPRYRCVTEPGSRGHAFSLPVPVRQPTRHHPDSGAACPRCEHVFERHEGVRIVIFGSGELAQSLMRRNLVDEYVLLIHPLVLGSGRRLFADGGSVAALRLVDTKTTTTGVVIATYQPLAADQTAGS